jgi:hypothetical protein
MRAMSNTRRFAIGFSCAALTLVLATIACSERPAPTRAETPRATEKAASRQSAPSAPAEEAPANPAAPQETNNAAAKARQATAPARPSADSGDAARIAETVSPLRPEEPAATPPPGGGGAGSSVADPGGAVEVVATKAGLSRIGNDKCKMCHKVQFASWAESAHAARMPPLDCESCHGPGSEYGKLAVMKDPEQARAAGLVTPDDAFCSTCHEAGPMEELRQRVHAHKVPST